jgi:hypothetical protein
LAIRRSTSKARSPSGGAEAQVACTASLPGTTAGGVPAAAVAPMRPAVARRAFGTILALGVRASERRGGGGASRSQREGHGHGYHTMHLNWMHAAVVALGPSLEYSITRFAWTESGGVERGHAVGSGFVPEVVVLGRRVRDDVVGVGPADRIPDLHADVGRVKAQILRVVDRVALGLHRHSRGGARRGGGSEHREGRCASGAGQPPALTSRGTKAHAHLGRGHLPQLGRDAIEQLLV